MSFFDGFRSRYSETAIVLGILFFASAARAEDRVLTLDEAIALARDHNRDLLVARAHLEESAASVEQAWVALLPQLSLQGKYTHNYKNVALDLGSLNAGANGLAEVLRMTTSDPDQAAALKNYEAESQSAASARPPIVIQKGEQLDFAINAVVPLLVPYAYSALHSAQLNQRSATSNVAVTEANVLLGVARAYFAAAGTDELMIARRHAVSVATETFDNAKARVAAGVVNRVEITRAESVLVHARQDLAESESARSAAYRALATLLGLKDRFNVRGDNQILDVGPRAGEAVSPADASRSRLREQAIALRPEFAMYEDAIEAASASARSDLWRWAPTISAFGNARAFNYAGFAGDTYSWALGAQLDWVLYDGGARDALRHVAEAQRAQNQARLDLLRDTVEDEIANASEALDTKRQALEAARRALDLSKETLGLVRAQYEAGTTRQLEVLQAQDALVASEVSVVQAHFNLALADLELQRAVGSFPAKEKER